MQEGSGRKKYNKQFKEEAVRLLTEGGRQVTDVARSLGIHENLLHTCKKKYQEDPSGSFPGGVMLCIFVSDMVIAKGEIQQYKDGLPNLFHMKLML